MSSEALERLRGDLERGKPSRCTQWVLVSREDCLALLTEVARLERANAAKPYETERELVAALAVAREREQRAVSRLEQQLDEAVGRWHETCPHEDRSLHGWLGLTWDEYATYVQGGAAALVDENPMEPSGEPAAATMAA